MTQYSQVQKNVAASKVNVRHELAKFEQMLEDLKVQYEQYFIGVLPLQPEKLHLDVKRALRRLYGLPFKSSAVGFQVKVLENRYSSYNSYWQRVLRAKEDGTYSRDVFKADLRARNANMDAINQSADGAANKQMQDLFISYKTALEHQTNRCQNIDFDDFKKSLVKRAKLLREQHGTDKLSFKVVVKNGKVTISAESK
jgi:hypothetical protein